MRGQKLFVRPIESGDFGALQRFFAVHASGHPPPQNGLVGKLAGELVAVMGIDVSLPGKVRLECLLVAPDLRRKRIGRVMIRELESLAVKLERDWLIVERAAGGREFLRKVGFVEEGSSMVRRVGT